MCQERGSCFHAKRKDTDSRFLWLQIAKEGQSCFLRELCCTGNCGFDLYIVWRQIWIKYSETPARVVLFSTYLEEGRGWCHQECCCIKSWCCKWQLNIRLPAPPESNLQPWRLSEVAEQVFYYIESELHPSMTSETGKFPTLITCPKSKSVVRCEHSYLQVLWLCRACWEIKLFPPGGSWKCNNSDNLFADLMEIVYER